MRLALAVLVVIASPAAVAADAQRGVALGLFATDSR